LGRRWVKGLWFAWAGGLLVEGFAPIVLACPLNGLKLGVGWGWLGTLEPLVELSLFCVIGKGPGVGFPNDIEFASELDTADSVGGLVVGLPPVLVRSPSLGDARVGDLPISSSSESSLTNKGSYASCAAALRSSMASSMPSWGGANPFVISK
jgi:hypothetical protein